MSQTLFRLASIRSSTIAPRLSLRLQTFRKMASVINPPRDPNTLSNYNNFITTNTTVNLEINFQKKNISGNVILELTSATEAASKEILLDTSHLNVKDVRLNGEAAEWNLLPRFEPYGSILKIHLQEGIVKGRKLEVSVSHGSLTAPSYIDTSTSESRSSRKQRKIAQLYSF